MIAVSPCPRCRRELTFVANKPCPTCAAEMKRMADERQRPAYWTVAGDESHNTPLHHKTQYDALDDKYGPLDTAPETVEMYGWAPVIVCPDIYAERVLDVLLEDLDGEYGNPDGECSEVTDKMKVLAGVFVRGVLQDYTVYQHEIVEAVTARPREFLLRAPETGGKPSDILGDPV